MHLRLLLLAAITVSCTFGTVCAAPLSELFPRCWGGRGNQAVYCAEGLMTRQIFLYANSSRTERITGARLLFEFPADGLEVAGAVIAAGPGKVRSDLRFEEIRRDNERYIRAIVPLYDIEPGFRWEGARPWSKWPGWWSALYLQGKKPGTYGVYWHIKSDQGDETERMVRVEVLPRPAAAQIGAPRSGRGVGVWAYSLSLYGQWPEIAASLADTLAHAGVRRLYLDGGDGARLSFAAARARNMEAVLVNDWPVDLLAPGEPPEAVRARDAALSPIPGNAWCPTAVAERHEAWVERVRPYVAGAMQALAADGFMLNYEGAAAEGHFAADICFCDRCRTAFDTFDGSAAALQWPDDVRPGGRLHEKWLKWRHQQGAHYVENVMALAREARADAATYTWSGGAYRPYPAHEIYSRAGSDISLFAPGLTAATVGAYAYPNDPEETFRPNPDFGTAPDDWGTTLPDMIALVQWSAEAIRPVPLIACVAGTRAPAGEATPLAAPELLRYQVANHMLDGAVGVDFWGSGPLEDGRYIELIAELAAMFHQADAWLGSPAADLDGVQTDAQRWRARSFTGDRGSLAVVISGDDAERGFQVVLNGRSESFNLPPFGVRLIEYR